LFAAYAAPAKTGLLFAAYAAPAKNINK
jgi:hypothetical protein